MPKFVSARTNTTLIRDTTSDQVVSDCRPNPQEIQYYSNDSNGSTPQYGTRQERTLNHLSTPEPGVFPLPQPPSFAPNQFRSRYIQAQGTVQVPESYQPLSNTSRQHAFGYSNVSESWGFSAQNGQGQPASFLQAGVHLQGQQYEVAFPNLNDPSLLSSVPAQPTQPYMLTPEQLRLLQAQTNYAPPHQMQTFPYSSPEFAQNVGVGVQPPPPSNFFPQAGQGFGVPMWSHHRQQQAVQESHPAQSFGVGVHPRPSVFYPQQLGVPMGGHFRQQQAGHPVQMTSQAPYYEPELSGSQVSAPSLPPPSRLRTTHNPHQPYPTTRPQRREVSSEAPVLPQPEEAVDAEILCVCRFPNPMNPSSPCACPLSSEKDARTHVKDHISAHHIPLAIDNKGRQCFQCPWNSTWNNLPAENGMKRNMNFTGWCNQTCRGKSGLVKHYLTHIPIHFQCPKCGKYFARNDALKRHLKGTGKKACSGKKGVQAAEEDMGAGVDSGSGSGSGSGGGGSPTGGFSGEASGSGSRSGMSGGSLIGDSPGEASASGSGSATPSGDSSVEATASGSGNSGTLLADSSAEATGNSTSFDDSSAEASGSGSAQSNDASPNQLPNGTSASVANIAGPSSSSDENSEINETLDDMQFASRDQGEVDEAQAEDTQWDENFHAFYAPFEEAGLVLKLGDGGS